MKTSFALVFAWIALLAVSSIQKTKADELGLVMRDDEQGCFPCCFCCEGPGTCCYECRKKNGGFTLPDPFENTKEDDDVIIIKDDDDDEGQNGDAPVGSLRARGGN